LAVATSVLARFSVLSAVVSAVTVPQHALLRLCLRVPPLLLAPVVSSSLLRALVSQVRLHRLILSLRLRVSLGLLPLSLVPLAPLLLPLLQLPLLALLPLALLRVLCRLSAGRFRLLSLV